VKIIASCAKQWPQSGGLAKERGLVVSFRKHARVRLGERRREAKLSCQRILDKMDCERQQLKEHGVANAIPSRTSQSDSQGGRLQR
jgi:hypothetical protein